MQMQREAQQHEWTRVQESGFNQFSRYLQGSGGSGGHGGGLGLGGTHGSPLKYEMGGGGEMLPVMRDT